MAKQTYGLIGHPVKHSLSPAMHNAAFAHLGIDAEYTVFDVKPEDLEKFLDDTRKKNISGLNVTIPHKIKAKEYMERKGSLDDTAKKLGAVNTIKAAPAVLSGYNTDGPGFYRSLVEDLKFEPEGKTVFVLGAGGAASAIVMYLGNGPRLIYVADVDTGKIDDLKSHYRKYYDEKRFVAVKDLTLKEEALEGSDLLINATPAGMKDGDQSPIDSSFLHSGMYVYDLVYNRPATELVKEASRARCRAVTGLGMLLYQGAIAFEIWTGKKPPIEVMKRALKEALKNG